MKTNSAKTNPCLLLGALASATLPLGAPTARADDAASRVDALVDSQFSNEYLTPRGMVVQDKGLTYQQLVLGFVNVYKGDKDGFLNSVTLVPGVWADFASRGVGETSAGYAAKPRTDFVEIDPIAGVNFTFLKNFTLSETYTAFCMQIEDIGTSQHAYTKLEFNDSDYLHAFALHPYFLYWQELYGKATDADLPYTIFGNKGPGPGSSYYFEVGVAPSYTFSGSGLKLEAPCRVLLPDSRFYGTYYASSSTVGLYELGVKATYPLSFPKGFGHWSLYAGVRLMEFADENLVQLNQFNAPGKPVTHEWQGYGGLTIFF